MSAFTDLYPNLPGMLVDFKDGGLALRSDTTAPSTDSLLLLGTAVDGPYMEPVAVDAGSLELIFGKDVNANGIPNGATIGAAFKQAYDDGCRDIRVMKVTGQVASATLETPLQVVVSDKVQEDPLAVIEGNDETTLTLVNTPIENTVQVYAKGIVVSTGVSTTGAVVTVAENSCDAGSTLSISYDYMTDDTTPVLAHATEYKNATVNYVAAGISQAYVLSQTPIANTIHLYINGAEILSSGAFTHTTGTAITVDKTKFTKGSVCSIRYTYINTSNVNQTIEFKSIFASKVYNEGSIEVKTITGGIAVVISKPISKKNQIGEDSLVYNSTDYPVFGSFVAAVNADANNGLYKATTNTPYTETAKLELTVSPVPFAGGDDGINPTKDEMFKALSGARDSDGYLTTQGAYQLLEDYQTDWVTVLGVYADDELSGKYQNFAYELALFCAIASYRNNTTLGTIAMKPASDIGLADLQTYTAGVVKHINQYLMRDSVGNLFKDTTTGSAIDLGKFLSVVAGPESEYYDTALGAFYGNPAVTYAALNSTLLPQSAPTNKKVAGARRARYRLSNTQLDTITGNRIVSFKTKNEKYGGTFAGVFCVDGVTAALTGSDYTRLTTPKALRTLINNIREVADPFLGESTSVEQRNALSAAISKRIGILIDKSVIQDAEFQLICTLQDQVLGQASIELSAVPPQEFRKITTVVGLKSSL